MDLTLLADFNLVAAQQGFAAAARASGRSKATLSRNVKRLEDELRARLIERNSHAFRLTEDGAMLFARSEALLAEVREIGLQIEGRGPEPRGKLRLSAPLVFSHTFLGALAADFRAKYPQVTLEATVEDRMVDMVEEGYDVVIRVNPAPGSDLVGRCFFRDRIVVAAVPGLRPTPTPQAQPVEAIVLVQRRDQTTWTIDDGGVAREIAITPALCLPSLLVMRDAALAGAGPAALPLSVIGRDLASGRLVAWGDLVGGEVELWVLHTSRRATTGKVRAFVAFLSERFAERV